MATDAGPLTGVRVFDWTIYGVGPFAGVMLGALGADVIKIEAPGGDAQIRDETRQSGMSTMYINQNLCKRSVTLDLKTNDDRRRALELVATCDVFLNNMRPGTPERIGLGYDAVREVVPSIVYCVATGWGSTGPMADLGGVDLLAQAFSGVAGITGPAGGDPEFYRQLGNLDYSTSSYIVAAVLEALYARARTGRGAEIELSLFEAAVAVQGTRLAELLLAEQPAPRRGAGTTTHAPDGAYLTADRKYMALSVVSDDQWQRVCHAVGLDALAERSDLETNSGRVRARDELDGALAEAIAAAHSEWWSRQLTRHKVPHAVAGDFAAMRDHAQIRANGHLTEVPTRWGRIHSGAPPWEFSDAKVGLFSSPFPGQHDDEVFAELPSLERRGAAHANTRVHTHNGDAASAERAYAGLRVLDLSSGISGPYCTNLLAAGGADVTKLERPAGDYARAWEPRSADRDESVAYAFLNGGKTVVQTTTEQEYRQTVAATADEYDVVVVDAVDASGRRARLDALRANPRAVVCTVAGYGKRGPLAAIPASELTCQVLAAVPAGLGSIGAPPIRIGADIASTVAGVHAFQAVNAALLARERTGRGQQVTVSPLRSMIFLKSFHWGSLTNPDTWGSTHIHQSWTRRPNHGYRTGDGRITFVWYRGDDESFARLLDELELTERVRGDDRFAVNPRATSLLGKHGDSCVEVYESAFAARSTAEIIEVLGRSGAYAVPVLEHPDLVAHPQFRALDLLQPNRPGTTGASLRRPWRSRRPAPSTADVPTPQPGAVSERSDR